MNYEFLWDGGPFDKDDISIGQIIRDPWQRPTLGQELMIKGALVRVVRINPSNNPDDQKVQYFVEPVNSNWPYKMTE